MRQDRGPGLGLGDGACYGLRWVSCWRKIWVKAKYRFGLGSLHVFGVYNAVAGVMLPTQRQCSRRVRLVTRFRYCSHCVFSLARTHTHTHTHTHTLSLSLSYLSFSCSGYAHLLRSEPGLRTVAAHGSAGPNRHTRTKSLSLSLSLSPTQLLHSVREKSPSSAQPHHEESVWAIAPKR